MKKIRVAILISGRGSNMESLIRACTHDDYPAEIAFVISNKVDAAGIEKAKNAGIKTLILSQKDYTDRIEFEISLHNALIENKIGLVCLAGFMKILGSDFVNKWSDRIINIHPSLLPDYPGLHTYERALADQRTESGCTVHHVIPEMDAGPIILQRRVPILPGDTPETLAARILTEEHLAYPQALRSVAENLLNSDPVKL